MKYCLLALFSFLIIASCKKVEVPLSIQEKMRAADWAIDTMSQAYVAADGSDSSLEDGWPHFEGTELKRNRPDCLKDDYFKFRENHDGSQIPGPDKCKSSETNDIQFTWGLRNNDKNIYIYGLYNFFSQDVDGELLQFEDEKFTMSYLLKVTGGTPATTYYKRIKIRFKKK